MNFFLLGRGKVGSAISKHFAKENIYLSYLDIEKTDKNVEGLLFLAVPDDSVSELTEKISKKFRDIIVVHFSAASDSEDMHLLHPYCSVGKETTLSDITFTLWSKKPEVIGNSIEMAHIKFVYAGTSPSLLYHTSAVLSGNFSQFLAITALELLEKEGFDKKTALTLLNQLMNSSLKNINHGAGGISGPASRGDGKTLKKEASELRKIDHGISEIFEQINEQIKKVVKNGTVFGK